MRKISAKVGVTALSVLAVFAISVPDLYAAVVNCNSPNQSLQGALDQASDGDTITVVGGSTCLENIVVKVDHVTLDGKGTATIDGSGDPASDTIRVLGRDVTIKGFTVTGGRNGIHISESSSANISECVIISNVSNGIRVHLSSDANIDDSTMSGNGVDGVIVDGGSAGIKNNTITGNGDDGLSVQFGSFVELDGLNLFESNVDDGVQCSRFGGIWVLAVQDFGSGNGDRNTSVGSCALRNLPPVCDPSFPLGFGC